MCGIAGFTGHRDQQLLEAMTNSIAYRGPDDKGFFSNGRINLGHRRLSIIDLSTGSQPMMSPDQTVALVFNGEIYNYRDLQHSVAAHYHFRTKSDTEVLLALYEKYGEKFIEHLDGMFVFALWDDAQGKLILARDRMGKKPLYYGFRNDSLYFGSEPKTLLSAGLGNELDTMSLRRYLLFQYVPGEDSMYRGIKRLLPGHSLVWQGGSYTTKPFWHNRFDRSAVPNVEQLDSLLDSAVAKRLISDVPLGVFLSGGLDSSTVSWYASRHYPGKIKTFSIGFEDTSFDETQYSDLVAAHLMTDHHHQVFSAQDLLDLIPKVYDLLDEPMADASLLPTFLLSQYTRSQVTVALGGDGADELFAGYPTFIAHRFANLMSYVPQRIDTVLSSVARYIPVSHANISLDFKLKRFLLGMRQESYWRDIYWTSAFNPSEQQQLLHPDVRSAGTGDMQTWVDDYFNDASARTTHDAVLRYWQQGYLVDDILTKVDRASMYNSLEVRAPFLDTALVEYVNSLPYDAKLRGFTTKWLLKRLMANRLPERIVHRPKKGFGIPISSWLNKDLAPLVDEILNSDTIMSGGLFNADYVQRLLSEHRAKKADHRMKLWTLVVFMLWHKKWMKS